MSKTLNTSCQTHTVTGNFCSSSSDSGSNNSSSRCSSSSINKGR